MTQNTGQNPGPVKKGGLAVRIADPKSDASAILDGARDFISRMTFVACLPNDEGDLAAALTNLFGAGLEVIVAEKDGSIVAGIGLMYGPYIWNPKLLSAVEMFLWMQEGAPHAALLRILRFAMARTKEVGAHINEFQKLSSSPASLDKVYARMGLERVQETWMGMI